MKLDKILSSSEKDELIKNLESLNEFFKYFGEIDKNTIKKLNDNAITVLYVKCKHISDILSYFFEEEKSKWNIMEN